MITPGLHPLCQLLSIYKFEILHHSILGNSDKRRDFDPTVHCIAIGPLSLQLGLFIASEKNILFTYRQKQSILLFKWPFSA